MMNDTPSEEELYQKITEWQLSDDEVTAVNKVLGQLARQMREVFGPRATIAIANAVSSWLANLLTDEENAFFIFCTVNDWLRVVPRHHGGMPFHLAMGPEPTFVEDLEDV
jgi:hypothetical protein